jgi:hypothetical protein
VEVTLIAIAIITTTTVARVGDAAAQQGYTIKQPGQLPTMVNSTEDGEYLIQQQELLTGVTK